MVVTQRIAQGETFDMSWSPERPGQWLFHCHMFQHMIPAVVPNLPGRKAAPSANGEHVAMQDGKGMGQLVLGITVPETSPSLGTWRATRKLKNGNQ